MKTRLYVPLLTVFLTGICVPTGAADSSDGRSRDTMATVLDFGDYGVYPATPYPCFGENRTRFFIFSEAQVSRILSAPADNAVATMDLRNALSLIHLKTGGRCGLEIVKKGFLETRPVVGTMSGLAVPAASEKAADAPPAVVSISDVNIVAAETKANAYFIRIRLSLTSTVFNRAIFHRVSRGT